MRSIPALVILTALSVSLFNCADYELLDATAPDPVALWITAVHDSSVTLCWNRSRAEDFRHYRVFYSTSDIVDTADHVADTLSFQSDTTKTVRHLTPSTRYYFRIIISTERHLIAASNIADTTTLKARGAAIELGQVRDITDSTFTVRWQKSWHPDFVAYHIVLDTAQSIDSSQSGLQRIVIGSIDSTGLTFVGLRNNYRYTYKVFIYNTAGCVTMSRLDTVRTASGLPLPVVLSERESLRSDTSMQIFWSRCPESDFYRYVTFWSRTMAVDTLTAISTLLPTMQATEFVDDTLLTISGLTPATTYRVAVYVQDRRGLVTASNVLSLTTDSAFVDTSQTVAPDMAKASD